MTDVTSPFFAWLLSQPKPETSSSIDTGVPSSPAALDEHSLSVLARLDEVIQSDLQRNALLPRAPQVLPQLMRSLRDDHYVSVEVAARIGKDAVLAAEVIRAANGSHRGSREPIVDLSQAVLSIGADHLRRVIARSVLRPIFNVRGASLSALAAPQIWINAEFKARLCSALATAEGLDPLDGYLAGMLHDCGWTALLRALDGLSPQMSALIAAPRLVGPAMAWALADRRDLLFCKLMRPWQLSMPLVAMADEIETRGLAAARSPLAVSLQRAHGLASMHALACDARLPDGMDATLMSLPPGVQACYLAVTRAG
jgi:HD-like signal output (HDOD) protein